MHRSRTPNTPNASAYQTNVFRTKTRKWVEAKKVTYDGDDWGNEYEDEEEEEELAVEPPPPLQPQPLRNVGGQPPAHVPQLSSGRTFSQPSTFGHIRGESFGARKASGPPSLRVETQQSQPTKKFEPVETTAPSYAPGPSTAPPPPAAATERRSLEQVTSPQYCGARPFASPVAAQSARADYSLPSQSRVSPPPAGAAPSPSRFPPRKSSISQERDGGAHSRSASHSSNSGRPWPEPRSSSPGRQAPTSAGPAGKPLPFIRPADIYRRMEEEKEKERQSLESGRPSLDSLPGAGSDTGSAPGNTIRSPIDQQRRPNFERDDRSGTARGPKSALAPVEERRSEYGLERLITEANKDTPGEAPAQESATNLGPGWQPTVDQADPAGDRRKSVSPRLPDLARMSVFGSDFFSGSSTFSTGGSTAEPVPPLPKAFAEQSKPVETGKTPETPIPAPPEHLQGLEPNAPHQASILTEGSTLGDATALLPATTSTPSPSTAENKASEPEDIQLKQPRPLLPGGWVSETTTTSQSVTPTPIETTEAAPSHLPTSQHPERDSVAVLEARDPTPPAPLAKTPPNDDAMQSSPENEADGGAKGTGRQLTPQALPPLQTPNPLAPANPPPTVEPDVRTSDDVKSMSIGDSPSKYSSSTHPRTATTVSEFTPTAPLNPRRCEAAAADFVAPDFLPRHMTISSGDASSPDESDRLREDIIRSLSPVNMQNAGGSGEPVGNSFATGSSPDLTRESRYLSGVYDDYIGLGDEKSSPDVARAPKDEVLEANRVSQPTSSCTSMALEQGHPDVPRPLSKTPEAVPPALARRFSWEKGAEPVELSPVDAPPIQLFDAEPALPDTQAASSENANVQDSSSPPAVQIELDNSSALSHRVSLVSSHAPGGLGVAGIDPPSPISVASREKSPEPTPNYDNRMSLVEEKVLLHSLSTPGSFHDEHPALSDHGEDATPAAEERSASPVASSPVASPVKVTSIIGWREILSLPTPGMRIEKFEEARVQYKDLESGLSSWLEHMSGLSDTTGQGTASNQPTAGATPAQTSPSTAQSPQQPYYQQYMNASNPNITPGSPGGSGRPAGGNMMSGNQAPVSGFSSSGNQMGAKSKELLHAAGVFGNKATKAGVKGGMKLFNKGRNKLRGTGDKVFQ
jgi:hypothetical protein